MPTPTKPVGLLVYEGKSHRTKAELEQRQEAEEALLTGRHMEPWPEVKKNKAALLEFNRVKELLGIIEKDDALHEAIINRYALIRSECLSIEKTAQGLRGDLTRLASAFKNKEVDFATYMDSKQKIIGNTISLDKQLQTKRRMLFDIEKENIMTIASALRSIPKTPPKEEKKSGMAGFMQKKRADNE